MDLPTLREGEMSFRKLLFVPALTLLLCLAGSFPAAAGELQPSTLTWVAGGVGGGWYVQAGGIARLITEKESKLVIKVVPGGGVVNPVRVSRHKDDLGWGITFVDNMAYKGTAPLYRAPNPDVASIGGIFGQYVVHFVAAKSTGVNTLEELCAKIKAGEKVSVAAPMKGTSDLPLVRNILGYYGVKLEDIENAGGKIFHAVYADMVTLYKDRHVDYVFTHLALPGAAVTEMAVSRDLQLLSVDSGAIDKLHDTLGTMASNSGRALIPGGTYPGVDQDVSTVVTAGELLVNKNVPEETVYTITKILCENIQELYTINEANKFFVPEKGWAGVAVPLHPGAERYYREAGFMK